MSAHSRCLKMLATMTSYFSTTQPNLIQQFVCFEYCIRAMMYGWVRSHWCCWVPESQKGLPVYDTLINMFSPPCRGRLFFTKALSRDAKQHIIQQHLCMTVSPLSPCDLHLPVCLTQRRQWHPTPVLLPRKSHGQRSLVGCSPWGS